jgi:hypothetical protein
MLSSPSLGWLAGWLPAWLAGWLAGWLAAWLAGWLAVWLAGWLAGWLLGTPRKCSASRIFPKTGKTIFAFSWTFSVS